MSGHWFLSKKCCQMAFKVRRCVEPTWEETCSKLKGAATAKHDPRSKFCGTVRSLSLKMGGLSSQGVPSRRNEQHAWMLTLCGVKGYIWGATSRTDGGAKHGGGS